MIKKVKKYRTVEHVIDDLNGEESVGRFYRKELQKTIQKEFRIEKVIKIKGGKLYVKWEGYNDSFNSWIKKRHWDTSTSSQDSSCDGFVLDVYLGHKFQ